MVAILHGIDPSIMTSLCHVESRHNPAAYVKHDGNSPSYGLCQIKLATAKSVGFTGKPQELFDPVINAHYAARYLAKQMTRYHGNVKLAVSAYNAGRAIKSNHKYVKKVMSCGYKKEMLSMQ